MHKKLCTIFPEWVVQFICSSITILVKRLAEIAFNHFIQKYGGWVSESQACSLSRNVGGGGGGGEVAAKTYGDGWLATVTANHLWCAQSNN